MYSLRSWIFWHPVAATVEALVWLAATSGLLAIVVGPWQSSNLYPVLWLAMSLLVRHRIAQLKARILHAHQREYLVRARVRVGVNGPIHLTREWRAARLFGHHKRRIRATAWHPRHF